MHSLPWPWVWVFALWAVLFGIAAFRSRRLVWLSLAALSLSLVILEVFTGLLEARKKADYVGGVASEPSQTVGYTYKPNQKERSRAFHRNQLLFDVTYTIDSLGQRVTGERGGRSRCLLFFGDSFMFGHGVTDEDTLPYRVNDLLNHEFRVYNFGVSGYGPHQMLLLLESGEVSEKIDCETVEAAFFLGIPDHLWRISGRAPYGKCGPRYVLGTRGSVHQMGNLCNGWTDDFMDLLDESALYRRVTAPFSGPRVAEIDLYVAILRAARDRVEREFGHAPFHVIYYDWRVGEVRTAIAEALARSGLTVHFTSEFLGETVGPKYWIPFDGHARPIFYERIAHYIAEGILHKT